MTEKIATDMGENRDISKVVLMHLLDMHIQLIEKSFFVNIRLQLCESYRRGRKDIHQEEKSPAWVKER